MVEALKLETFLHKKCIYKFFSFKSLTIISFSLSFHILSLSYCPYICIVNLFTKTKQEVKFRKNRKLSNVICDDKILRRFEYEIRILRNLGTVVTYLTIRRIRMDHEFPKYYLMSNDLFQLFSQEHTAASESTFSSSEISPLGVITFSFQ